MQNTPHVADLPLHLVVVDSGLPDLHILLADLPANTRVHYIHEHEDALSQIAYAANQYQGLEGLHVLGHGEPGRMLMGGQWIDAEAVESSPDQMACVSGALTDDAHIWLYGCHSAQGDVGQRWLDAWALATGAGVHGSDQPVGCTADGFSNWILESVSNMPLESDEDFSPLMNKSVGEIGWKHTLTVNSKPTFNLSTGKVATDFGNGSGDTAHNVVLQSDGKILVAGFTSFGQVLVRYNQDGSLDTAFSDKGVLVIGVGSPYVSVSLQADGKILALTGC